MGANPTRQPLQPEAIEAVMEATAGRQEPYTYGSLPGREDFFFVAVANDPVEFHFSLRNLPSMR